MGKKILIRNPKDSTRRSQIYNTFLRNREWDKVSTLVEYNKDLESYLKDNNVFHLVIEPNGKVIHDSIKNVSQENVDNGKLDEMKELLQFFDDILSRVVNKDVIAMLKKSKVPDFIGIVKSFDKDKMERVKEILTEW